ncbi:hypothetical protein [Sphingobacterium multivorum]|uniref:hypothetical protein n=1 Tax=Sphingobacterium multivorum TaxID=28454 RepID=UPI0031BAFF92
MKQLRQHIRPFLFWAVFGTIFIAMNSCKSNQEDLAPEQTHGDVLKVSVKGSSPRTTSEVNSLTAKAALANHVADRPLDETFIEANGFDALVSSKGPFVKQNLLASAKKAATNTTASALPDTTSYRLLIFNQDGTNLLHNVVATVGKNPEIPVEIGMRYKWVAFSINASTVPDLNKGKIAAADIANKDVLYASGTLDTQAGENLLEIVFDHKTVRFDVNIDTRGIFGGIQSFESLLIGTGTGAQFKSLVNAADFDLLTGQFGTLKTVDAPYTAANIADKDPAVTGHLVKTVSIYTILPTGTQIVAKNLTIQPIFSIKLDHEILYPPATTTLSTRKYGTTSTYLPLNNPSFNPGAGDQYELSTRLIESAIKVNGISWARSDLWYDGSSGQIDKYRFKADAGIPPYDGNSQSEYWNWKATTPAGIAGSGDPCVLVYPANTWRMPTQSELTSVVNTSSYEYYGLPNQGGSIRTADTYQWYAVVNQSINVDSGSPKGQGDFSGYSDKLIFTFNGYRLDGTINATRKSIDSHINRPFTQQVSMGYWSSTGSRSNAVCMVDDATVDYQKPFYYSIRYQTKALRAYGGNYGFNVRCVRK